MSIAVGGHTRLELLPVNFGVYSRYQDENDCQLRLYSSLCTRRALRRDLPNPGCAISTRAPEGTSEAYRE